jgi:hypothetical protein
MDRMHAPSAVEADLAPPTELILLGSNSTCLVSSIKVEVKKKHFCAGWSFSCFSAQWMEQDLF